MGKPHNLSRKIPVGKDMFLFMECKNSVYHYLYGLASFLLLKKNKHFTGEITDMEIKGILKENVQFDVNIYEGNL